eukprot:4766987-Prymnesium_polylepis.1
MTRSFGSVRTRGPGGEDAVPRMRSDGWPMAYGGLLLMLLLAPTSGWRAATTRQSFLAACAACSCSWAGAVGAAAPRESFSIVESFSEQRLGLELTAAPGGRVQVKRVVEGGAASKRGIPPLVYLESVNGQTLRGENPAVAEAAIRSAARPVTIEFDGSVYAGLSPDQVVEKAAAAQGFETARITIRRQAPRADDCGLLSREGDAVEFEFTATVAQSGYEFD